MKRLREAVIVGYGQAPLLNGRVPEPTTPLRMQAEVGKAALKDAGLEFADVDGLLVTGAWANPGPGMLPTVALSEYLGINPRFSDSTRIGGASFETHVAHAALAIESGMCDVALITYASLQKSDRSRTLAGRSLELGMQFESPWGLLTPVGGYALAAQRYLYEYGRTLDDLTAVAASARRWSALNPEATLREPLRPDEVARSPMISDPLRRIDCCLVTDGAGALVMTYAENVRSQDTTPVYLRGYGEAQTHWNIAEMPDLTRTCAAESGREALQRAGISLEAVDLVELYDSFTITVLLTLESLGFCEPGTAGDFIRAGNVDPGGVLPMNTNGGGLAYAHPGMYGIFLLVEAIRQLRGEAGDRQVEGASIALVHGTGGTLSTGATCILSNS